MEERRIMKCDSCTHFRGRRTVGENAMVVCVDKFWNLTRLVPVKVLRKKGAGCRSFRKIGAPPTNLDDNHTPPGYRNDFKYGKRRK